ncbi:MAG: DNA primase [Clostridiales bacterium]|nr:DNA primase [Clostridiales bacterium]
MISPEVIEEIKERCDIESIVSSYVTLKRAGSNLNGLCPFHSEKTPSFTVFPIASNFYCFGCGAGGDVITFIMKIEGLDYPGALEFLAKRAGIPLDLNGQGSNEGKRRARILSMNREAGRFFHKQLYEKAGIAGHTYLTQKRGLSDAVIKHFGLGFAPNDFGALTSYLSSLGYTRQEMTEGFLCGISRKTDKPYDYFRNRVIFPIIDVAGNLIAFGGRVMDDSTPKYLNTSDTPAFKKSKNLFALNFAKKRGAEHMILCEGYMDVIALHAAGFDNAVATLGTAITPEQARLLKRYTKKVFIAYDSDAAGQRAAERAFRLLAEVGVETKLLKMKGAKDPDEYLRKFGDVRFKNLMEEGKSRFDFTFDNVLARYDLQNSEDRIAAAKEMTNVLSGIVSGVERDVYTHKVADHLKLPFEALQRDVDRLMRKNRSETKKSEMRTIVRKTEGYQDRVNPDYIKNVKAAKAEEGVLGILLQFPELIPAAQKLLSCDDFCTEYGRIVYEALQQFYIDGKLEIGRLNEVLTEEQMGRVMRMKVARDGLLNNETVLHECANTLKMAKNKKEMDIYEIIDAKRRKQND